MHMMSIFLPGKTGGVSCLVGWSVGWLGHVQFLFQKQGPCTIVHACALRAFLPCQYCTRKYKSPLVPEWTDTSEVRLGLPTRSVSSRLTDSVRPLPCYVLHPLTHHANPSTFCLILHSLFFRAFVSLAVQNGKLVAHLQSPYSELVKSD